jgi:hypothetical protein
MSLNIYNNIKETNQSIYDSYNNLVFNDDKRVFQKMVKKIELYLELKNKDIFGDIVEFGVFKGGGMALWLKLKDLYEPHSLTKIIGFDFFEPSETINSLDEQNKKLMENVLNRVKSEDLSLDNVNSKLSVFNKENYMLIKGDAVEQSNTYYTKNVGAKIKILYMDLDVGEPTYQILITLWDKLSIGGIIICDEYGFHGWDETLGVDKFLKQLDKNTYEIKNTNILSPTMIILKK